MKTQLAFLAITVILMQLFAQTEAGFWGKLWEGVKNAIGKRGLRNVDQIADLFDSGLSDADDLFDSGLSDADAKFMKMFM
uniref:Antimicrobial peptide UyCT1 n=1 Tax=Urodacus yaschenkoi TaxID=1273102 RepID=NDB4G_UROYA|nr:RecName: Full=Antimicrobial peptide UyCT1; Short=CT1; AltName: Full=Non-disulfide-bridged peptide 4.16; Short=NDBP-4.16; AltName: Full=Non-disulfide-bridged peptide 5.18; Short=NDBP-5.18; Contains: RecName: Full=Antimicrobial peptide UyCT2; AltName: Full=Non-disulfide-bridged peptide 5.19; Short=NDBP-5.19; Flags: Precursor [Urodacus yaschenkoi]AGA82754.1 antimicrobial peptide CT1-NDBP-5.17 precursor [Urodacus yaschenkoi]